MVQQPLKKLKAFNQSILLELMMPVETEIEACIG